MKNVRLIYNNEGIPYLREMVYAFDHLQKRWKWKKKKGKGNFPLKMTVVQAENGEFGQLYAEGKKIFVKMEDGSLLTPKQRYIDRINLV